jgi:hypothetical protein
MKKVTNDSFEHKGTTWYIHDDIKLIRLPEFEKLIHHFITGVELDKMGQILMSIREDLNNFKFAEAGYKIVNLTNATHAKIEGIPNVKILIATLFIDRKGEESKEWSLAFAQEKIKEWEDIGSSFFLQLSEGWLTNYFQLMFGISKEFSEAMIELGNRRLVTEKTQSNIIK